MRRVRLEKTAFPKMRRMIVNEHLSWRRRSSRQTQLNETESPATVPDPAVHTGNQAQVEALLTELPRRQRAAVHTPSSARRTTASRARSCDQPWPVLRWR